MKYFAWIFWIPFILLFLGFTVLNNYRVSLDLWMVGSSISMPLPMLLFIVLLTGFLWGYMMAKCRSFFKSPKINTSKIENL